MWVTFYKRTEDSFFRRVRFPLQEEAEFAQAWFIRRYVGCETYVSPPKNGH